MDGRKEKKNQRSHFDAHSREQVQAAALQTRLYTRRCIGDQSPCDSIPAGIRLMKTDSSENWFSRGKKRRVTPPSLPLFPRSSRYFPFVYPPAKIPASTVFEYFTLPLLTSQIEREKRVSIRIVQSAFTEPWKNPSKFQIQITRRGKRGAGEAKHEKACSFSPCAEQANNGSSKCRS